MNFDLRNWGTAMLTVLLGTACSSTPTSAGIGQGEGGGGVYTLAASASSPIEQALSQSDSYFITQYHHVRYNPEQSSANNANCGPTSLAMALKAFGREPSDLADADHARDLILYVRQVMTGTRDESTWTYPSQVQDGARRMGLNAEVVFTLDAIEKVMAVPGRLMVVNVNPSPAYADQLVYPYDGGHFALLTAIKGNKAYLNDPLANGPITLSLSQLETALTTPLGSDPSGRYVAPFDGGIALWD